MKRIVIIGSSCAGKSTLGRSLSKILCTPIIELDTLFWLPNWKSRPTPEFREIVLREVASDNWIVDGNYSRVRDIIWPRATTIIWLNYPLHTVLVRAMIRTCRCLIYRKDPSIGNRDTFSRTFLSRNSIFVRILSSYWSLRLEYQKNIFDNGINNVKIIEFKHHRETEKWLKYLQNRR